MLTRSFRPTPTLLVAVMAFMALSTANFQSPGPTDAIRASDTSGDGVLDINEFDNFLSKVQFTRTTTGSGTYACLDANGLFAAYDADNSRTLDANELSGVFTHFFLQSTQTECTPKTTATAVDPHAGHAHAANNECGKLSNSEVWVTSISVACLVTLGSFTGALFLAGNKDFVIRIIPLLLMFGIGALLANSIFHLIPEAFEVHSHAEPGEEEDEESKAYLGKGAIILVGIGVFFMLEQVVHHMAPHSHLGAAGDHHAPHGAHKHHGHNHLPTTMVTIEANSSTTSSSASGDDGSSSAGDSSSSSAQDDGGNHLSDSASSLESGGSNLRSVFDTKTKAFGSGEVPLEHKAPVAMVLVAGALHNFTDGLIIGTTFHISLASGFAATLAIIFHEIPQEISDFVVLINFGYTIKKALLFNFLSGVPAILGAIIGTGIGVAAKDSTPWLAAISAGGFIYIALAVLAPELVEGTRTKGPVYRLALLLVLFVSIILQWAIAAYSESINFSC